MKLVKLLMLMIWTPIVSFGQSPVTVKPSPAATALVAAAKDAEVEQKSLDMALQQARTTVEATQKQLAEQINEAHKKLDAELHADKKYKDEITTIDTLEKQISDNGNQAQQKFFQTAGPIQNKIATDKALIDGLVPIVREENGLSPTATFDPKTQTWTDSAKTADKPAESKK